MVNNPSFPRNPRLKHRELVNLIYSPTADNMPTRLRRFYPRIARLRAETHSGVQARITLIVTTAES
jgi:hypothetical protein